MKNWRLSYRVAFISCAIVIFFGLIIGFANASDGFGVVLGIVCLLGGLLSFVLSFFFFLGAPSKEWAKGFLLCGGILLLLSGVSCGAGLSGLNFH